MEEIKPVIDGVNTEDTCMAPAPATENVAPPEPAKAADQHERPWGMPDNQFGQFLTLVMMGLERLDKRQRWATRKHIKLACKELNVRWPFGRPIEDIQREIAEQQAKTSKIIIPQGINADALKEKGQ